MHKRVKNDIFSIFFFFFINWMLLVFSCKTALSDSRKRQSPPMPRSWTSVTVPKSQDIRALSHYESASDDAHPCYEMHHISLCIPVSDVFDGTVAMWPKRTGAARHVSCSRCAVLQWLATVYSPPLELSCILSRFNHKCKCILLGFYVIDQHKVMHNFEVEGKWYMVIIFFFYK